MTERRDYTRRTDVLALMADIGDGVITVEEAAPRLQRLLVPMTVRTSPTGDATALLEREQDDSLPPYVPNSWNDVEYALHSYRHITLDQVAALRALVKLPPAARSDRMAAHLVTTVDVERPARPGSAGGVHRRGCQPGAPDR